MMNLVEALEVESLALEYTRVLLVMYVVVSSPDVTLTLNSSTDDTGAKFSMLTNTAVPPLCEPEVVFSVMTGGARVYANSNEAVPACCCPRLTHLKI
jgi:hypothetical protein